MSSVFTNWCHKHRIENPIYSTWKTNTKCFMERFNRSYRTEVLDARIFNNLIEVREITSEWIEHYNNQRPHESLQNLSPMQYLLKKENTPAQNTISMFSPFQQNSSTSKT